MCGEWEGRGGGEGRGEFACNPPRFSQPRSGSHIFAGLILSARLREGWARGGGGGGGGECYRQDTCLGHVQCTPSQILSNNLNYPTSFLYWLQSSSSRDPPKF